MSLPDDDDKPTVVLDLKNLKKDKLNQEEELANLSAELQFSVHQENEEYSPQNNSVIKKDFKVLLFDFQSNFFENSLPYFPHEYEYLLLKNLQELNQNLKSKNFQILIFNYDANPKAVNQLCAQIKQKVPSTKTLIMAKNISPEKAKAHSRTPFGANAYYQLPLDNMKLQMKFEKIYEREKKAS